MTIAASGAGPTVGGWPLSVVKLAYRALLRDRLSLIGTLLGIVYAIVPAVPFGRIAGPELVPVGTNSFDDPSLLPGHEKHAILSPPDVAGMEELAVGFVASRKLGGGAAVALFVGSDARNNRSLPWNIIAGSITELSSTDGMAVQSTYFKELGILQRGDCAKVNNMQLTAQVVTSHNVEDVRKALLARLPDVEVIAREEFDKRSLFDWLFERGAGAALIAGAALGAMVGVISVAQTLYSSTGEQVARLRVLGAVPGLIRRLTLTQAVPSAASGYAMGSLLSLPAISFLCDAKLLIVMTANSGLLLLALIIGMCVFAPISTIRMTCVDPAVV